MSAFIAELEARFDDERGRDLDALIDELTDAERASVTLSARLAGADGDIDDHRIGARFDPLVGAPARKSRRQLDHALRNRRGLATRA